MPVAGQIAFERVFREFRAPGPLALDWVLRKCSGPHWPATWRPPCSPGSKSSGWLGRPAHLTESQGRLGSPAHLPLTESCGSAPSFMAWPLPYIYPTDPLAFFPQSFPLAAMPSRVRLAAMFVSEH